MGDLGEHFNASEFRCHDDSPLPNDFGKTIKETVEFLERLRGFMNFYVAQKTRTWLDIGIQIVSGHRALAYNRRIGSKDTSAHVTGHAADISPISSYRFFSYDDFHKMATLVDRSFSDRPYRIGKYSKSRFLHVDCKYEHGGRRWGK